MVSSYSCSNNTPPKSNITASFTITEVNITTEIVLTTPCLSIQFAIKPGMIFPITAREVPSCAKKIIFLDKNPKKNPRIKAKTILRFPYKNTLLPKTCMIIQTIMATNIVTIIWMG